MGVLKKFEQRLEGLVNGTFAKVFKSEVQPVEIAEHSSGSATTTRPSGTATGLSSPTTSSWS